MPRCQNINPEQLIGRYIPNLTATLPAQSAMHGNCCGRLCPQQAALDNWDAAMRSPETLGCTLLIEPLAWQFASPVRWIETQDAVQSSKERRSAFSSWLRLEPQHSPHSPTWLATHCRSQST